MKVLLDHEHICEPTWPSNFANDSHLTVDKNQLAHLVIECWSFKLIRSNIWINVCAWDNSTKEMNNMELETSLLFSVIRLLRKRKWRWFHARIRQAKQIEGEWRMIIIVIGKWLDHTHTHTHSQIMHLFQRLIYIHIHRTKTTAADATRTTSTISHARNRHLIDPWRTWRWRWKKRNFSALILNKLII